LAGCGDAPELFAVLYRRHADAVLVFLVRRTADAQVAADLCAETFAAAFAQRARFRDERSSALPWLFGIARRQLGSYARRQRVSRRYRRRLGVSDVALGDDELDRVEQLADLAAIRAELAAALDALPDGQRDAVRLRVVDELPYVEVARRLGVSEGAARVRVSRALAALADTVEAR
jgi:RNA polymerase sigma-70 factor (ECF subfamily)